MERLYDRALRIATGQLISTPIEALQRKAMSQATQQLAVKTSSKQKRNPYTAQQTIQNKLPSMSKYHSGCSSRWRRKAKELPEALPDALNHRQQMESLNIPLWHLNALNSCDIYYFAPGIRNCTDNISFETRISIERIDNHHAHYII